MSAPAPYIEPRLTPKQREAVQQGLLPFMLRFGGRAWIRVGEAAAEFQLSTKFFYERMDLGVFELIRAGKSYVLTTRSVLLWALVNSNFDHSAHEDILRDYLALQPKAVLARFIALATTLHARAR